MPFRQLKMNNKIKIILIILLFAFFCSLLIHEARSLTQDLGRHLKTGEIIWKTKNVPKINLFSYTEPTHRFINTHWLSEVVFYGLFNFGGFKALIIFKILIILVSFGIVFGLTFLVSRKSTISFWIIFLLSLFTIGIMTERTDIRPEIFSFLIFSLYLFVLFVYLKGTFKNLIWVLPILQLFWVNFHIYFFLGPALYTAFFLEEAVKNFRTNNNNRFLGFNICYKKIKEFKSVFIVGVLIAIATLINPNGISGAFYPLEVMRNYGYTIIENQTPFFLAKFNYHQKIISYFFISFLILIAGFFFNFRKISIFKILTSIFVSFLGLYAIRNFPIFALAMLPITAENFSNFKSILIFKMQNFRILEKILFVIFFFILTFGIYRNVSRDNFSLRVPNGAKAAVEFVLDNNINGKMFNNYDVGSYLIWRLYPLKKVFVDNRPEAYSTEFFKNIYIPMQKNEKVWRQYAEKYDFNFVFFEYTDITPWAKDFLARIIEDQDWPMIYHDERVVIFIKRKPSNQDLIEKYKKN
jgi:hypothetical protein